MNNLFNQEVEKILYKNGWYPERRIDAAPHLSQLKQEGYFVNPCLVDFIERFGQLAVVHSSYSGEDEDQSIFDVRKALDTIFSERVKAEYETKIGKELCPIGVGFSEHLVYLLTPGGEIYAGFDSYFCLIGDSVSAAFTNIFFTHDFTSL